LSDSQLEKRARLLRGQGMDPHRRYFFPVTGYNFRLTNVCAAMLCAQLERREEIMRKRLSLYALYTELLSNVPGISLQPVAPWATLSPWLYCVTIDKSLFGIDRDSLMAGLFEWGIDTRPFFIPLHTMPPYEKTYQERPHPLPVTESLASVGVNLPTFTEMSNEQVSEVCNVIKRLARL
jgi:perosamine synthetase